MEFNDDLLEFHNMLFGNVLKKWPFLALNVNLQNNVIIIAMSKIGKNLSDIFSAFFRRRKTVDMILIKIYLLVFF